MNLIYEPEGQISMNDKSRIVVICCKSFILHLPNLTVSSIFFCLFAGSIIHDINILVDIIMQPLIETLITMDKGILSSIVVSIYLAYSFLQNGKVSSLA